MRRRECCPSHDQPMAPRRCRSGGSSAWDPLAFSRLTGQLAFPYYWTMERLRVKSSRLPLTTLMVTSTCG